MSDHVNPMSEEITSTEDGMRIWQQERVIFEVTEKICELMDRENVTRAELADRLGKKTRGYITQLLSGNSNMTLRTVSDVFLALGRQFHPEDGPVSIENDDCPILLQYLVTEDDVLSDDAGEPNWKVAVN
jgi:transcriptional regulator with XRE-family HTH domain